MADRAPPPPWFRQLIDGGPGLVWLAVLLITRDFFLAAWFLVVGAVVAIIAGLVVERRLAPIPAVTGGLAVLFGGASLLFHRADILQMKMTILDGLFGAALFVGLALKKNPLKALLGGAFDLPDRAWRTLTIRYGLFFWACAIANEIVRRTQTVKVWSDFRGAILIAVLVFALAQAPYLLKHNRPHGAEDPAKPRG